MLRTLIGLAAAGLVIMAGCGGGSGAMGLHEATGIVYQDILNRDVAGLEVWHLPDPLPDGGHVTNSGGGDYTYTDGGETWFFFIDDAPATAWPHACRYVFVNRMDGKTDTIDETWAPDDFGVMVEITEWWMYNN